MGQVSLRSVPGSLKEQPRLLHWGVSAEHAHDREKLGVFCYNWQYSCLSRPYYTPTTLGSLITQWGFFLS